MEGSSKQSLGGKALGLLYPRVHREDLKVQIEDTWVVGLKFASFSLIIFGYLLAFELLYSGNYIKKYSVTGHIDTILINPPNTSDVQLPNMDYAIEKVKPIDNLSYCWKGSKVEQYIDNGLYKFSPDQEEYKNAFANFTAENKTYASESSWPCVPLLASIAGISGRRGLLVATSVMNTWSEYSSCATGDDTTNKCASFYAPNGHVPPPDRNFQGILNPKNLQVSPQYFVANIEQYWVGLYQSFTSLLPGFSGSSLNPAHRGRMKLRNQTQCRSWQSQGLAVSDLGETHCYVHAVRAADQNMSSMLVGPSKEFRPGLDYFPLQLILDAGKVNLDKTINGIPSFTRKAGVRLQLYAVYSNFQPWGVPSESVGGVQIEYRIKTLDHFASRLLSRNQYAGTNATLGQYRQGNAYLLQTQMTGVLISALQEGEFGRFNFLLLMNVVISAAALVISFNGILLLVYLTCFPRGKAYAKLIQGNSNDSVGKNKTNHSRDDDGDGGGNSTKLKSWSSSKLSVNDTHVNQQLLGDEDEDAHDRKDDLDQVQETSDPTQYAEA